MARVSKQEKAKTHDRIIDVAAKLFRENGIEATGIADIMKEAGLTHGGFYRHFQSKDALVVEAIGRAVSTSLEKLRSATNKQTRTKALLEYVDLYLSDEHVLNPGKGCPLAALGSEAPHMSGEITTAFGAGTEQAISTIAQAMNNQTAAASALMSTLLGSVVLARMAKTTKHQNEVLLAGKQTALKCMNQKCS